MRLNSDFLSKHYILLAVMVIIITAFLLRWHDISGDSFSVSESAVVNTAIEHGAQSLIERAVSQSGVGILYGVFARFWVGLVPVDERWLRLSSMVFGVLSILLFYLLSRVFLPKSASLFTALIISCSPIHIEYCRRFNPQSAFIFFCSVMLLSLFYMYKRGATKPLKSLFLISASLAVNIGITALIYLTVFWVFLFFYKDNRRMFTLKQFSRLIIIPLFLSVIPIVLECCRISEETSVIFKSISINTILKAFLVSMPLKYGNNLENIIKIVLVSFLIVKGLFIFKLKYRYLSIKVRNELSLLLAGVCLSSLILLIFLYSLYGYIYYESISALLLYPVSALCCAGVFFAGGKRICFIFGLVLLYLNISSITDYCYARKTSHFREASSFIKSSLKAGDMIVSLDKTKGEILNCYGLKGNHILYFNQLPAVEYFSTLLHYYNRTLWVISTDIDSRRVIPLWINGYLAQTDSFEEKTINGGFTGVYKLNLK